MYKKEIKLNTVVSLVVTILLMSIFINPSTAYALQNKDVNGPYEYLINLDEKQLNKVDPKYIEKFILENEIYINSEGLFETKKNEFTSYLHNLNKTNLKEVIKNKEIEIFSEEEEVIVEEVTEEEVKEEEVTEEEVTEEEVTEEEITEEEITEEEITEEEITEEEVTGEEIKEEEITEEEITGEETTEEVIQEETNKIDEKQIETNLLRSSLNSFSYNSKLISDTTYVVQPGDYLGKIASIFKVTVAELVLWNNLTDKNVIHVGQTLYIKKPDFIAKPDFSTNQEFVNFAATYASQVAKNSGLYASVMIAQAILESNYGRSKLSTAPYNNLFGIKSFRVDEPRVNMPTKEQDKNGNEFTINAYFRVYPSYFESFESNANLLRTNKIYTGAWVENTKSYKDATAWLQGKYATDVNYASKLNNLIQTYNLTQYDTTFRIEIGNFLGEANVQDNLLKLKKTVNWNARYEEVTNIEPFYSKEIQVGDFYYLGDVQQAVNSFKRETGFWAGYRISNTFSYYYVIKTGTFNGLAAVKEAINKFEKETGWYASYEQVDGNRYRIVTGYFLGETNVNRGLDYMKKQGWWAEKIKLNQKEPNYIMYTGEFNSEWSISMVKQYLNSKNWSSKEIPTGKTIKYYRIVTSENINSVEAAKRVKLLRDTFNWDSYIIKN